MWRRVSCEQLLDTSQSILRLSGSIVEWCGDLLFSLKVKATASAERETGSYSCTWSRNRLRASYLIVATRTELETSVRTLGRVVFSA